RMITARRRSFGWTLDDTSTILGVNENCWRSGFSLCSGASNGAVASIQVVFRCPPWRTATVKRRSTRHGFLEPPRSPRPRRNECIINLCVPRRPRRFKERGQEREEPHQQ